MNKPLLLLVDDDRSVLDALEAEMRAEFSDLCRVEVFDEPRGVLAALPGWAAERRSIAVAIVDQKMPAMSGVELIAALRTGTRTEDEFEPGGHLRAILLTGFAGLESALVGKNVAGVNRYLEKPWTSRHLTAAVSELLAAHLAEQGADAHLVFRPVDGVEDLREHFAIRFESFSAAAVTAHLVPGVGAGLDVDEYDRWSHCFNVDEARIADSRAIGAIRMIPFPAEPSPQPVLEAIAPDAGLMERAGRPLEHPLPLMKYLIDRDVIAALLQKIQARGERAVEGGRLAVRPSAQGGHREAAKHLVEGVHASGWILQSLTHALLTCTPFHAHLYVRYGYRDAAGIERRVHSEFGEVVVCLHATPSNTPPPIFERLDRFAQRMRVRGNACRCGALARCATAYVSGDFSSLDILCPALASERLRTRVPPG